MTARNDADYYLTFSGHGPAKRAAVLDAHAAEVTAAAYRAAADEIEARLRAEGYDLDCACDACTPCLLREYPDHLRARADQMGQQ